MTYGYIRVSKKDQSLQRQIDSIKSYCPNIEDSHIYHDQKTGKNFAREQYQELKQIVKAGDEIIVHELDRFGRNKEEIKLELKDLKQKNVHIRILNIPTTLKTPAEDDWMFDMVNNILIEVYSSLAEKEREMISSRTKEGQAAARRRGKRPGRPALKEELLDFAIRLYETNEFSTPEICQLTKIGRSTFYVHIQEEQIERAPAHKRGLLRAEKKIIQAKHDEMSDNRNSLSFESVQFGIRMWRTKVFSVSEICATIGCVPSTFYRYLWLVEERPGSQESAEDNSIQKSSAT